MDPKVSLREASSMEAKQKSAKRQKPICAETDWAAWSKPSPFAQAVKHVRRINRKARKESAI